MLIYFYDTIDFLRFHRWTYALNSNYELWLAASRPSCAFDIQYSPQLILISYHLTRYSSTMLIILSVVAHSATVSRVLLFSALWPCTVGAVSIASAYQTLLPVWNAFTCRWVRCARLLGPRNSAMLSMANIVAGTTRPRQRHPYSSYWFSPPHILVPSRCALTLQSFQILRLRVLF